MPYRSETIVVTTTSAYVVNRVSLPKLFAPTRCVTNGTEETSSQPKSHRKLYKLNFATLLYVVLRVRPRIRETLCRVQRRKFIAY